MSQDNIQQKERFKIFKADAFTIAGGDQIYLDKDFFGADFADVNHSCKRWA